MTFKILNHLKGINPFNSAKKAYMSEYFSIKEDYQNEREEFQRELRIAKKIARRLKRALAVELKIVGKVPKDISNEIKALEKQLLKVLDGVEKIEVEIKRDMDFPERVQKILYEINSAMKHSLEYDKNIWDNPVAIKTQREIRTKTIPHLLKVADDEIEKEIVRIERERQFIVGLKENAAAQTKEIQWLMNNMMNKHPKEFKVFKSDLVKTGKIILTVVAMLDKLDLIAETIRKEFAKERGVILAKKVRDIPGLSGVRLR